MYSRDAVFYDQLNQHLQTADIPLYASEVPAQAKRVCEVACGTGRILLTLDAPGRELIGIDLSEDMLRIARQKSADRGIAARWLKADMRELPDMEPMDVVICGYNSMQHLCSEDDALAFLRGARRCLAPGGIMILDVFNPDPQFLFPDGNLREIASFSAPYGAAVRVEEQTLYHPETLINDIVYRYYIDGSYSFSESYRMRQYAPDALDRLIERAGLRILRKYGDYDRGEFTAASPKQIFVLSV